MQLHPGLSFGRYHNDVHAIHSRNPFKALRLWYGVSFNSRKFAHPLPNSHQRASEAKTTSAREFVVDLKGILALH